MKVTFHLASGAKHQEIHAAALKKGMEKHGLHVDYALHNTPLNSDLSIIWSYKQPRLIETIDYVHKNIMIMERGYFPDRDDYCSLTMNGFHGRGHYTPAPEDDNGKRFDERWGKYVKPWKDNPSGYVLLAAQVPGDPTIFGLDMINWLQETADQLNRLGYTVRLRWHPWTMKRYRQRGTVPPRIRNTVMSEEPDLYKDLDGARCVVTFNSTTANDAILYGVPIVTMDEGCLAYEVSSHSLSDNVYMPDRSEWFKNMAWKQWSIEDLESGLAWEHSRMSLPEKFHNTLK